jgi:hypothetical protein
VNPIQLASLEADHAHSRDTDTEIVPVPPVGPNDVLDPATVGWHRVSEGAVTVVVAELPQPIDTANDAAHASSAEFGRNGTAVLHAQRSPSAEVHAGSTRRTGTLNGVSPPTHVRSCPAVAGPHRFHF